MSEWSATEQAVADVIREESGLPYGASIRDIWEDARAREENIAALKAADQEADEANLAFVRRIIAAAHY